MLPPMEILLPLLMSAGCCWGRFLMSECSTGIGNGCANALARKGTSSQYDFVPFDVPPSFVLPFLSFDNSGLYCDCACNIDTSIIQSFILSNLTNKKKKKNTRKDKQYSKYYGINVWINYINGLYSLHQISNWTLTF